MIQLPGEIWGFIIDINYKIYKYQQYYDNSIESYKLGNDIIVRTFDFIRTERLDIVDVTLIVNGILGFNSGIIKINYENSRYVISINFRDENLSLKYFKRYKKYNNVVEKIQELDNDYSGRITIDDSYHNRIKNFENQLALNKIASIINLVISREL